MVLGLSRRPAAPQEESIPEDLIASIPILARPGEVSTTFAIEREEALATQAASDDAIGRSPAADEPALRASTGTNLAQQLRYDLGEALARELDRGAETIASAFSEMEGRLARAEADLASARAEVERERAARETAEKRLAAFKELALK